MSALLDALDDERCWGGDEDDCGEGVGIAIRASHRPVARVGGCRWLAFEGASDSTQTGKTRRTAGVICRWQSPSATGITAAGLCRCQRAAWRHKTSQWKGKGWGGASDLARRGTQGTAGSCDGDMEASAG